MKHFTLILYYWLTVTEMSGLKFTNLPDVLDFVSVVSTTWSNRDDFRAESIQDRIFETKHVPVDIPALYPHHVIFTENSANGIAYAASLGIVRENEMKINFIYVDTYLFRNTTKYRPGEIKLDQLYNLTLDEINKECTASYVSLGDGIFSGLSPVCINKTEEKDGMFSMLFTCDHYVFTVLKYNDRTIPSPFVFRKIGARYPLIHHPHKFETPCYEPKRGSTVNPQVGTHNVSSFF